jgi:5-methylcytosine-specific restriction endonuclease McrA
LLLAMRTLHVKNMPCDITRMARVAPPKPVPTHKRKATIPKAIREQVWCEKFGQAFSHKCSTRWCSNCITVFDFQIGHDIPESKGGTLAIANLIPICSRCNLSMSNVYSFKEWERLSAPSTNSWWRRLFNWNRPRIRESS